MMKHLSCSAGAAVATCDSANFPIIIKKKKKRSNEGLNKQQHRQEVAEIRRFEYVELERATEGFSPSTLLGRGSHGCVYRGVLDGGRLVAIKRPTRPRPPFLLDNEIEILSNVRSPRLVNLLGFSSSSSSSERLLVVEYMANGTLSDVLHSHSDPPGWPRRVSLALQTAEAIDSLHRSNPPVIHRDIKSTNVLIDSRWRARLGDFGLALREDDARFRATPPAGTMGYLDPSYLTPDGLSTKADVFSFGILLLEIISGRHAIDVNHAPPSVVDWALPFIRRGKFSALFDPRIGPPRDAGVRRLLAVIAASCVRPSQERRPSMAEVVVALKEISRSVPLHVWEGLTHRIRTPYVFVNLNPCSMVEIGCRRDDVNGGDGGGSVRRGNHQGRSTIRISNRKSDGRENGKVVASRPTMVGVIAADVNPQCESCKIAVVNGIIAGEDDGISNDDRIRVGDAELGKVVASKATLVGVIAADSDRKFEACKKDLVSRVMDKKDGPIGRVGVEGSKLGNVIASRRTLVGVIATDLTTQRNVVGGIMAAEGGDGSGGRIRVGVSLAKSQPLLRVYNGDDVFRLVKEQSIEGLRRSRSLMISQMQYKVEL